ncbi:receptor-like cytosolic serine/threonine-protein kinase RBK2 [Tasmannia lanceolata]|uniref:receptor-like cytosolic serine/threonine-protein kinase RBK2 n=1 Tax=Tasmannia lanceolata TaxID=3420 RepID=UPI0040637D9A
MVFPAENKAPVVFSVSASALDLRSLDVEKEEKEVVDGSSPRGVLEDCMRSLESETSSSKPSTSSYSESLASPTVPSQWRGFFRLWRERSMRRLSTFPPRGVPKIHKRNRSNRENQTTEPTLCNNLETCCFKPSWINFSHAELREATNNFSSENVIGMGGFAEVYKGCLQDGQLVAIKRLTRGTSEERIGNFLAELGIIVHINHPNAAKLIGFGIEGGMHLVLQLSPHGSLASRLHGSKEKLEWRIRYKVALGTAEGLQYLHEGCQRRIIHRDIKAANILLTEDFEPQICDFGLAKWLPDQWTHHTVSTFEGTFGYLAPEYFMHGIVDEKIDVFAFGVLMLELITGRKAVDSSQQSLLMWAKPLLEKNDMRELVDPSLGDAYDSQQMNCVAFAASLCIQHSSILRPQMSQVVKLLKGEGNLESMKLSQGRVLQRTYSEELLDMEEYNSTRYLSDLNRHKQIALDI